MSGVDQDTTPIRSILVANRGEIARRVFRTATEMGLRTIAVYVDADADAPFVGDAEMAIRIDSYLSISDLVTAAEHTGADAVHPGYGFLSENSAFAQAVIDAGIRWIGPKPDVIAAMGDKLEAKKLAVAAGVPTLPSSEDPMAGDAVGYPLLVKAAAGGGGKGMRIVTDADHLADAVESAQREALNGFGDDTVFLERYVPRSRHVEIQIMGDLHGAVIAHGERECSIQRRHQKIVEESPSPGITNDTRLAMERAAVGLGTEIGYTSAGTVEFLVDDATGEFFFLEVNTRLQVEHPVTEEARGIDLVREQLAIAMGAPATVSEPASRASIEVRLYAEDPSNDFLPATGTVEALAIDPLDGPGSTVRWDIGIDAGSDVTIDFDPMLGKVIASAPTRVEAALRLAAALQRLHLGGVVTNRDFLVNVLLSPEFLAGDTTTDFIDRIAPSPALDLCDNGVDTAMVVAAFWLRGRNRAADVHWGNLPAGFRNGRLPPTSVTLTASAPFFAPSTEAGTGADTDTASDHDGRTKTLAYRTRRNGSVEIGISAGHLVNENVVAIERNRQAVVLDWQPESVEVEIDGWRQRHRVTALLDGPDTNGTVERLWVQMPMGTVEFVVRPKFVAPGSSGPTGGLLAPMPGVVLDVRVAAGDHVTQGQTMIVLEAMKMEHHMTAPANGVVAKVHVNAGEQVAKDAALLTMAEDEA